MNPINKEAVSKRIRELRKKNEMTLESWSALFGSNKSAGYKWENGTVPYRRTLEKMAEFSSVSIDWILHGDFVDYVVEFMKQFPFIYKLLSGIKGRDYFIEIANKLSQEGKGYGDDTAILLEVLKDPKNQMAMSLTPEVQDYLKMNEIEIKDLNVMPVDNMPEYRFTHIHWVNEFFTATSDLSTELIGDEKYNLGGMFEIAMRYLVEHKILLKEWWELNVDVRASEEVQEKQKQEQKEEYMRNMLMVEQELLEMVEVCKSVREKVAKNLGINLTKFQK